MWFVGKNVGTNQGTRGNGKRERDSLDCLVRVLLLDYKGLGMGNVMCDV